MAKTALITGATGQDGAYLSRLLLEKGYRLYAGTRQNASFVPWRFEELGILEDIQFIDFDLLEQSNIIRTIEKIEPDEIYNLGAMSFVGASFGYPVLSGDTNALGTTRLLEAVRVSSLKTRIYQASTSEMFGKVKSSPQDENTPFHPRSPYAVAKLYAHWITINYRESYDMFAVSGILFNHESPLRGPQFVTRKTTRAFADLLNGRIDKVMLGNLDASRDWGHAADYVRGMWQMLQAPAASDYVLATGETRSVRDFVTAAGRSAGFDIVWKGTGIEEQGIDRKTGKQIVGVDPQLFRPAEVDVLVGNPAKAKRELDWRHNHSFDDLVTEMLQADIRRSKQEQIYLPTHEI